MAKSKNNQIKSKDRVKDLAEVYTNEREVNAMLDLIPLKTPDTIIKYKYLEPACGNGNFLIEILRRKLARINEKYSAGPLKTYEFFIVRILTTIYGIDICPENVSESRERLTKEIEKQFQEVRGSEVSEALLSVIRYILERNIIVGDAINATEKMAVVDYKIKGREIEQRFYRFSDLSKDKAMPMVVVPHKHFMKLAY
ncbi:hypothetical protein SAMN04487962_12521 [Marinobacter segnicrescens]|uniref:site-specific DNA-methyltransferase (adenine-specific) n=1 Tax=Marinobacter segnicrescens TaxID=430453 RepID=A0A1I0H847_9GAMM|nr:hypothetical protein [Marinobacter segnicrescens]SET79809.1 hypothetical protein SAMN04487962_12521 [Marinobacter segnicrescens]